LAEVVMQRIVEIGGGTGTRALVENMKTMPKSRHTAIVGVHDSGNSSGILRQTRGTIAFGDARNVMAGLVPYCEEKFSNFLDFRFKEKDGSFLNHHSIGNLVILAAVEYFNGDLEEAFGFVMKAFKIQNHRVLPVTKKNVTLCAKFSDGSVIEGEHLIDTRSKEDKRKIADVFLKPEARILSRCRNAILGADKVVLCAGSLWTSLIGTLKIGGVCKAIRKSDAMLIYVVNIMTNHNETPGYTASDHVEKVYECVGRKPDLVLVNDGPISQPNLRRYAKQGSYPVVVDTKRILKFAKDVYVGDFVNQISHKHSVRHNRYLAEVIHNAKPKN
jgi:uncharacterized cofD-like protein